MWLLTLHCGGSLCASCDPNRLAASGVEQIASALSDRTQLPKGRNGVVNELGRK
ncbi:hypothetical protein M419DRAFT_131978 [Trichoderma reesei RUT C-30]|uniref:Uncharacterized protein n=1 Tax=Hypocrea jecorina (strain ATCC 56765 / BCRC 32924 / NRRL 11460 / Rut C-30) TaxID=1344414 RepID=A0A024S4E2_HYPJR|nr:hypothetical protein M419DRAFT_131978 [Trichoderma reesei RUT C-30]